MTLYSDMHGRGVDGKVEPAKRTNLQAAADALAQPIGEPDTREAIEEMSRRLRHLIEALRNETVKDLANCWVEGDALHEYNLWTEVGIDLVNDLDRIARTRGKALSE